MHQLIIKAMEFANETHRAHMYSSTQPYVKHLENVYNVLLRYGCNEQQQDQLEILVSAWLHDSLEDTATSYSDVKKVFGESIAEIVYCLTDELGRNRKEKKERTYPKIRSNWKSIVVKVADRIANCEHSLSNPDDASFFQMYTKEYAQFKHELLLTTDNSMSKDFKKNEWILDQLWNRLDELNSTKSLNKKQVKFRTQSNRTLIAMIPGLDSCKDEFEIPESVYDEVIKVINCSIGCTN